MLLQNRRHPASALRPAIREEFTMRQTWIRFIAWLPLADATVLVVGGRVEARRGLVPARLLAELTELAATHGIATACIHARKTSHGFSLSLFGVPPAQHQRFRNVWAANWR